RACNRRLGNMTAEGLLHGRLVHLTTTLDRSQQYRRHAGGRHDRGHRAHPDRRRPLHGNPLESGILNTRPALVPTNNSVPVSVLSAPSVAVPSSAAEAGYCFISAPVPGFS